NPSAGPPPRTSRQASLVGAGIMNDAVCDQPVPYKQNDQRTNDRADEARTLVRTIPANQLAEPGRKECACHSKHGGEQEAGRIVGTGSQKPRDNAGDKADKNDPKDRSHGVFSWLPGKLKRL